jgi:hypothetical protein
LVALFVWLVVLHVDWSVVVVVTGQVLVASGVQGGGLISCGCVDCEEAGLGRAKLFCGLDKSGLAD